MHSDDHPALSTSVERITIKGLDGSGRIVYTRFGLEPASTLTLDDVPQNCVALAVWYFDATNPSPIHMSTVAVERDASGRAMISDPDTKAQCDCTTRAYIVPPMFRWKLNLSGASQYSQMQPTVAMSKNYVVVIYTAVKVADLRWMAIVGRISYDQNGHRQITWGSPQLVWDLGTDGGAPNASLNDSGWLVMVGEDEFQVISSKVCKVKDDLSLSCAKEQHSIAWGEEPSISIDESGRGVLMYTGADGLVSMMWYRLVYINEDTKTLNVMGLHQHDTGIGPRVDINEHGGVVEVHQSANPFRPHDLWLNVGWIDEGYDTISWGKSQRFETKGVAPVAVLSDDDVMMEAHYPHHGATTYYRYGLVNFHDKRVEWQGGSDAHELMEYSKIPALSVNRFYEVGAFVYASDDPSTGHFGLGELRQEPICPWPTVFTHPPYAISHFEAKSGGNVTNQGDAPVTQRGVCWSLSYSPTIDDHITSEGSGLGEFHSLMENLDAGVVHYVRAYAINSKGVGYGQEMTFKTTDPGTMAPTVTTLKPYDVKSTSAYSGGEVTKAGQSPVTARGVCWSTNAEPTIHDSKSVDGSGKGNFTSIVHGLTPGTNYFMRAYASNSLATGYGEQFVIRTQPAGPEAPTVTTAGASKITQATAVSGGFVVDTGGAEITARGVCWSTSAHPTIHDDKTAQSGQSGKFTSKLTGLEPGTTYHYRAYATNQHGTSYGDGFKLTTQVPGLPTVTTTAPSEVTHNAAVSGGHVVDTGSSELTARGVCWSTSINPTIDDNKTIESGQSGAFSSRITGLTPNQTYYVRAYATNQYGASYGEGFSFSTVPIYLPTVATSMPTKVGHTSAVSGGVVVDTGSSELTERGICWSTEPNPTIKDNKAAQSGQTGVFTSLLRNLEPGKAYYLRAYAINAYGITYGDGFSFNTLDPSLASVLTATPIRISRTTAEAGGYVIDSGYSEVNTRGVCWSTAESPTIDGPKTDDGAGLGSFDSSVTGLSPGTTYYLRAYVINSLGVAYGPQRSFTTVDESSPVVFTTAPHDIAADSAVSGGDVKSQGSSDVTVRGVCWSLKANPTVSDSKTEQSGGLGAYTSDITGLQKDATYHVRAYAANSYGASYGSDYTFTTGDDLAPTVETTEPYGFTASTAISGGYVTSQGSSPVTERGVCWSTSPGPTTSDNVKREGEGAGWFHAAVTGLKASTVYYLRAYAVNANGVAYGREYSFTTDTDHHPR